VNVSIPNVSPPNGDVKIETEHLKKESPSSISDDKKNKRGCIILNASAKNKTPKIEKIKIKGNEYSNL
jgi:hypothetical protein